MLNLKIVIQKIQLNQQVSLFQNNDVGFPWHFEPYRDCFLENLHSELFPFVFDKSILFQTGIAGPETQVSIRDNTDLWFADDYGVPGGMLIGILFPKNYVPEVFKFKEKPFIPTNSLQAASSPPGYVDVHFNQAARIAAITFLTTQNTYFGFKCIAKYYSGDFPYPDTYAFSEELLGTVGNNVTQVTITKEDLRNFKHVFKNSANLDDIVQKMNELITLSQTRLDQTESSSVRNALTSSLKDVIDSSGSITTIMDSYNNSGIVNTVISKLLAFIML